MFNTPSPIYTLHMVFTLCKISSLGLQDSVLMELSKEICQRISWTKRDQDITQILTDIEKLKISI